VQFTNERMSGWSIWKSYLYIDVSIATNFRGLKVGWTLESEGGTTFFALRRCPPLTPLRYFLSSAIDTKDPGSSGGSINVTRDVSRDLDAWDDMTAEPLSFVACM